MDMVMKGLSPINPQHVSQYLSTGGRVRASMQEAQERIETMVGRDAYNKRSLGAAHESERDYQKIPGYSELVGGSGNGEYRTPRNAREQMLEDMDGYGGNGRPASNIISSDRLLSLRERTETRQPARKPQGSEQDYYKKGYSLTIKYLNAFILNIKAPSSEGRLVLYKALKDVLTYEATVKSNQNLALAFKKGCNKAETEMYGKLKG
jgi:hypothetical protein